MLEEDTPSYSVIDMDEEIPETYNVEFTSQLLVRDGFYNGEKVNVVCDKDGWHRRYGISEEVKVQLPSGEEKVIPVSEFKIPLHLAKSE